MLFPTSRRIRRALASLALVLLGAAAVYAFINAGRFFTREDPLEKSDALFVLAGTFVDRPLEAAQLYRDGWAPLIVLSYGIQERAAQALARRGIEVERFEDMTRELLITSGIPADVIMQPPRVHDNTAQEAQTLRRLATSRGWHRVIVVSSPYHLRRARYAMQRELEGAGIQVVMRGTRYNDVDPDRWWRSRPYWRWLLSEGPKLIAYLLGLGA